VPCLLLNHHPQQFLDQREIQNAISETQMQTLVTQIIPTLTYPNRLRPAIQKQTTLAHTTLRMLFRKPRRQYLFSRRNRYAIGSVLASSLLELQNSSWLAKSLDKENILFHMQTGVEKTDLLTEGPYVKNAFHSASTLTSSAPSGSSTVQQERFATRRAILR
jgi:hypothetical protein